MRIAISGPACSGKTTFIKEFINTWKNYVTPVASYRDEIKRLNLNHSDMTSEETQQIILDYMINQLKQNKEVPYIIYDRCPLDVLIYTLQANDTGKVSDEFTEKVIDTVRESIRDLDIIFVLRYNPDIKIVENGVRQTNLNYILHTDALFKNIMNEYHHNFEEGIFFPVNDCPGIIELECQNKIIEVQSILNDKGDLYSIEDEQRLQAKMMELAGKSINMKKEIESLIESQTVELDKATADKLNF